MGILYSQSIEFLKSMQKQSDPSFFLTNTMALHQGCCLVRSPQHLTSSSDEHTPHQVVEVESVESLFKWGSIWIFEIILCLVALV